MFEKLFLNKHSTSCPVLTSVLRLSCFFFYVFAHNGSQPAIWLSRQSGLLKATKVIFKLAFLSKCNSKWREKNENICREKQKTFDWKMRPLDWGGLTSKWFAVNQFRSLVASSSNITAVGSLKQQQYLDWIKSLKERKKIKWARYWKTTCSSCAVVYAYLRPTDSTWPTWADSNLWLEVKDDDYQCQNSRLTPLHQQIDRQMWLLPLLCQELRPNHLTTYTN